jgi:hypothetical protein
LTISEYVGCSAGLAGFFACFFTTSVILDSWTMYFGWRALFIYTISADVW